MVLENAEKRHIFTSLILYNNTPIKDILKEYLFITTSIELMRVASEEIVYISSDGNYSNFVFTFGDKRVMTIQLGQVEHLLKDQLKLSGKDFIRIGKSLIINRNYINYINLPKQQLVLTNGYSTSYTLSASKDALRQLKEYIEKGQKDQKEQK